MWTIKSRTCLSIILLASFVTAISLFFCYVGFKRYPRKTHERQLIDIMDDVPTKNHKIFFHETMYFSPKTNVLVDLTQRQACSVESAARQNPNSTVYLLFTAPIDGYYKYQLNTDNADIKVLLKYPNVKMRTVNMNRYTKGTPLESILPNKSNYPPSYVESMLGYLSLWIFGGTHVNLDMIIVKDLTRLGSNFAAKRPNGGIASSILNLDRGQIGHQIADKCLKQIRDYFNREWNYSGSAVITRALKEYCYDVDDSSYETCEGFDALPASTFYSVLFEDWNIFFDAKMLDSVLKNVESSYGVHIWDKITFDTYVFKRRPVVALGVIAKRFCPNVFKQSGDIF